MHTYQPGAKSAMKSGTEFTLMEKHMVIKTSVPHFLPKERKFWKDLRNTHQKLSLVIWKLKRKIKIIFFSFT